MTRRHAIVRMLAAAGTAGLLIAAGSTPALAACTVNGGAYPSIQAAVNNGEFFIDFTGTCDPFVFIFHPVQLTGTGATPADNAIAQGMSVDGALRVTITNVQIGGDTSVESGIFFFDGANVTVRNSAIQTTLDGVGVVRGSVASFFNSSIQGRTLGASNNNAANVFAGDNSVIRLFNTTVTMNESNAKVGALSVVRNSELLLRGGNSITNTGTQPAIDVDFNSSLREDDPGIEASPPVDGTQDAIAGGMAVTFKSFADVRDATITGNVTVDLDSAFRVPGSAAFASEPADVVISGNVTASRQSVLVFGSSLTHVMGNVACSDKESHLSGSPTISGTNTCTPF